MLIVSTIYNTRTFVFHKPNWVFSKWKRIKPTFSASHEDLTLPFQCLLPLKIQIYSFCFVPWDTWHVLALSFTLFAAISSVNNSRSNVFLRGKAVSNALNPSPFASWAWDQKIAELHQLDGLTPSPPLPPPLPHGCLTSYLAQSISDRFIFG